MKMRILLVLLALAALSCPIASAEEESAEETPDEATTAPPESEPSEGSGQSGAEAPSGDDPANAGPGPYGSICDRVDAPFICDDGCSPPDNEYGDSPITNGADGRSLWYGMPSRNGGHDYGPYRPVPINPSGC